MATLMDYQDKEVMGPDRFYAAHRHLSPKDYAAKIVEMYGPPSGRDKKMSDMVNAAVLAYASGK
ncbi:MAG: hypothetical protein FWH44_04570 [Methanomassiliicoccaceae archaeon]|nr:hypothetical protein [Methanomassiliicoccaceae archaeon]